MNEEQLAAARERLKRDTTGLPSARELAWKELQNGTRPEWVAVKYGFPVETMQEAKLELERRRSVRTAERKGSLVRSS